MKKIVQMVLALGTLAIGIYMTFTFEFITPPSLSGIAFIFIGISLWMPHCPIYKKLFSK